MSYATTSPNMLLNVFCGRQDGKKWRIYLKSFSGGPLTWHTHIHTYIHTTTTAIGENATRCISPNKIAYLYITQRERPPRWRFTSLFVYSSEQTVTKSHQCWSIANFHWKRLPRRLSRHRKCHFRYMCSLSRHYGNLLRWRVQITSSSDSRKQNKTLWNATMRTS